MMELEEDAEELEINAQKRRPSPMDSFIYKRPETVVELEKQGTLKQTEVDDKLDRERRAVVIQYMVGFLYQARIPYNVSQLDSFKCAVEVIRQHGPNLRLDSHI